MSFASIPLHEEWRIILFTVIYGLVTALAFIFEAQVIALMVVAVAMIASCILTRPRTGWIISCAMGGFVAVLMAYLQQQANPPVFFPPDLYMPVKGQVERVEARANGNKRLTIRLSSVDDAEAPAMKRVRLIVRTAMPLGLAPGDAISTAAVVSPVSGPIVPGGYDFSKKARFDGISASGYAVQEITILEKNKRPALTVRVNALRQNISEHLKAVLPGQAGALAIALTVGMRDGINAETSDDLRRAGLAHLLAISGLHMGIVTGIAFFFIELAFAAIPAVALRVMPKKLAVVPAWAIGFCYLILSGASDATVRAFIMVSVAMVAVLSNRRVLSLRSVSIAALAIMLVSPFSIFTIGFQLSFAATTGLVVFYEMFGRQLIDKQREYSTTVWSKALTYVVAMALTSVVSQVAIAPVALYHFQTVSIIAVISNAVILPIVSFVLMPLLMLALVISFFGPPSLLGAPLLFALNLVLDLTAFFGQSSYAVLRTEQLGGHQAFLVMFAFLIVILLKKTKYFYGLIPVSLVAALLPKTPIVDVLVSRSGGVIGAMYEGQIYFDGGRVNSFRTEVWKNYWGIDPREPSQKLSRDGDKRALTVKLPNGNEVTVVSDLSAVRTSCETNRIVILPARYMRYCRQDALRITKEDLAEQGPLGIYWDKTGKPVALWSNVEN